jgi:4,5-DOPA dioxygenase extradiol
MTVTADTTPARMPAAFFGHGTPMNAIQRNRFTEAWRAFGASVPRPRAILMISAHWYINASAVTAMQRPRTIHDFYGFPEELFVVEYPAPGDPELADEITELVKPTWVGHDRDSWGIDHGAWSVLVHAFPLADIPVVQLSANALKPYEYHIELGAKLASLRDRGVLVLASGNIVHNLARMDRNQPDGGYPWARVFDDAVRETMSGEPSELPKLQSHKHFSASVPTPDHFVPVLYLAGLSASEGSPAQALVDGCVMGSLSMTAYTLGWQGNVSAAADGVQMLPRIPPDQSNM